MTTPERRPTRPPVTWATHWQHIMLLVAVVVGGLLFGVSFTLWPLRPVERWLGVLVLAGVAFAIGWAVRYVTRPVARSAQRRRPRP